MSFRRLLDVFFIYICGAFGSLFLICEGLGSELDGWMDAGLPSDRPEAPQDPEYLPGWGSNPSFWGPTATDSRATDYRLKTEGHRLQDRDGAADYKKAELIRLKTANSPPSLAA